MPHAFGKLYPVITPNQRVRIDAPHDNRHGQIGIVRNVTEHTADIVIDGVALHFGRSCIVPADSQAKE